MFKSLKLYTGQNIDLEYLNSTLVEFGYSRQEQVLGEGDFARRGEVIDIFPFSFELPVRIQLENEKAQAIKTFNPDTGEPLWPHNIVIILPFKKPPRQKPSLSAKSSP